MKAHAELRLVPDSRSGSLLFQAIEEFVGRRLKMSLFRHMRAYFTDMRGLTLLAPSRGQARELREGRPLGIAALEDKVVQQAVVTILNAIYEVDFQGFSDRLRPSR